MSNSTSTASNVIPMRELDRPAINPQEAQFERLLKECQGLAVDRLSGSISAMLDKVEEVLWGLADHTQDREVRDLYIAAKDKAIHQRKFIEEQFRKNYLAEFGSRVRADRKQSQDFSRFDLSSLELGLVNDEDLDETIKVNEMAAKLRRYCEEELNALDQRVGVLIGDANLQGEGNPFSPQAICLAYKQTCRQIDANLKLRMIFHRLFDDHVLDDVRSIYKDLNALLIQRSILPKIRYGIRRQPGAAGVRASLPAAGIPGTPILGMDVAAGATASNIGYGPEPVGGAEQDFYAVLQGLLAMNAHGPQFGGSGVPGTPAIPGGIAGGVFGMSPASVGGMAQAPGFPPIVSGPVSASSVGGLPGSGVTMGAVHAPQRLLQGAELIGSLTRLQQGDLGVIAGAAAALDASVLTAGTTNVVRELKSTQIGSSVDQSDALTLDIVAMLFDQIFSDKRVPYGLKVLIGRLQIPIVKVAVLDKKFFSKKSHPARRLLDTLGEFAFGLEDSFDQGSPVYKKLEDIVQRLLDGFEDDIQIFETLNEDVLALVRDENLRAENAAKDAARKIAYMERLEVGKAVAQFEIKRRAEADRISQLVLNFLADEWVKLLLLAYARHGNDSDAWKSALETMDLLIWSVNHKQSIDERRKLAAVLPGLLKRLQAGLQGIGTDPDRRKQFFSRLMRLHTKVISGNAPARRTTKEDAQPTLTESIAPATATDAGPFPDPSNAEQLSARVESLRGEPALSLPQNSSAFTETAKAVAPEVDEDAEPATQAPEFSDVTIKNPFGEGDIQIEEISLSDLPGLPELAAVSRRTAPPAEPVDQHSQSVTDLREGDWLEFRSDDDGRTQAKLSYVSPLKGTYLFVNRQGAKVGEYSLYQLAREFRTGRAVLLEAVPLLDRAMSGLVGVLKKSVH